jgi:hypothetical protein
MGREDFLVDACRMLLLLGVLLIRLEEILQSRAMMIGNGTNLEETGKYKTNALIGQEKAPPVQNVVESFCLLLDPVVLQYALPHRTHYLVRYLRSWTRIFEQPYEPNWLERPGM